MGTLTKGKLYVTGVCGEMCWPAATFEVAEIAYKLRYATNMVTRTEVLRPDNTDYFSSDDYEQ